MMCEKAAQVHAYHDGELDVAARQAFESHLQRCAQCSQLLAELRGLTATLVEAPRAEMPPRAMSRYYGAWHEARDRGAMRITGWLTAAAAVLLIGGLAMWPARQNPATVKVKSDWEWAVVMPPAENPGDSASEFVQVAQWMANDLSLGERR